MKKAIVLLFILLGAQTSFANVTNSEVTDLQISADSEAIEAQDEVSEARLANERLKAETQKDAAEKAKLQKELAESTELIRKASAERAKADIYAGNEKRRGNS